MSLLNDLTVLLECQAHDEVRGLFRRQQELLEHAASEADRLSDDLAGAEQRIGELTDEVRQLRHVVGGDDVLWTTVSPVDRLAEFGEKLRADRAERGLAAQLRKSGEMTATSIELSDSPEVQA